MTHPDAGDARYTAAGTHTRTMPTTRIAPRIIGGAEAPGAIGGRGIEMMSEALELERVTVVQRGKDIEVTGYPRAIKGSAADEG